MRFSPGSIAIHKADLYPISSSSRFLVVAVGELVDMGGNKIEYLWLDNNSSMPFVKDASWFHTERDIAIIKEMEKNK